MLHKEMHYEHGLIGTRMAWYVASQAFLMTAFATSGSYLHSFPWMEKWFIPGIGLAITVLFAQSVLAALKAFSALHRELNKLFVENPEMEKAPFGIRSKEIHGEGVFFTVSVPGTFFCSWLIAAFMTN